MFRRLLSAVIALVMVVCLLPLNVIQAKAASAMKASDDIVIYLKSMEGFAAIPHWDYVQWTVGYGNRCPDEHLERYLEEGIPIEEADALFLEQLVYFEDQVNSFMDKNNLTFTQSQFDAVLSVTYNCGPAWLSSDNDLRTAIIEGTTGNTLIGIMTQLCTAGGEYLPGLMRRRLTEADMYLNGRYNTQALDNYCYVFFDAGEGKATAVAQGFDSNLYAVPMVSASREGYTFLGWYTAETGGMKVTYLDENLHQATLYAHWQEGEGVYDDGTPVVPNGVLVTVTGDVLNIRSGPGTEYAVVASVIRGEQVVVTQTAKGQDGRLWGKIENGWICLEYTTYEEVTGEPTDPEKEVEDEEDYQVPVLATIVGSQVTLYNGPDTGYPKVGYLQEGDEILLVQMYKMFNTWWARVETGGWICLNRYVLLHNDQMLAHSATVTVTNSYLNVRGGPGSHYSWLGSLNKGDVVEILAVEEVDSVVWGRFSGGWISLSYTNFDASKLDYYRNHSYGNWYLATASTCVTPGTEQRDCKYCDHAETREAALGDHTYGDWYTVSEGNCSEMGQERRDCVYCDVYEERATEQGGHSFGQWQQITAPTCTEEGLNRRYCQYCDAYEEEAAAATGHSFGEWYAVKVATASENGLERRDCQNCDHYEEQETIYQPVTVIKIYGTLTGYAYLHIRSGPGVNYAQVGQLNRGDRVEILEIVPVGNIQWGRIEQGWIQISGYMTLEYVEEPVDHTHGFDAWYTVSQATCTKSGTERRDCIDCEYYETRTTSALGHDFCEWTVVTEGSCTEDRVECRECTRCAQRETRSEAAAGHSMGEWYMDQAPTCTQNGLNKRVCANCDYSETEVIDKLGHSFGDWYTYTEAACTAAGELRRECACGHYESQAIAATGHSFGAWYTVREATASQNGLERRDCQHCDHYEEQETTYEVETVTKIYGTLTGHSYLRIRSGPGVNYAQVGQLSYGDRVEILQILDYGSAQWGRISQGWIQLTGYITLEYVEEPVEHTHSYGDWYTFAAATCIADGEQRRECACGHYESQAIAATGHSFGEWYTVREATASQNGLERRECQHCDHYEERETTYEVETVTKIYGTLTGYSYLNIRAGLGTGYAVVGQLKYGERVEMLEVVQYGNHQWGRLDRGWVQITGYITLEYVEEPVEHTHSYGDWYTFAAATCTADGEQRRECACGHYESQAIAATGHSFGEWYTVKEATSSEKGLERRECQHCDHYEERETTYEVETVTKIYGTLTGYSYLNIRAGLGTGYAVVGQLKYGERVEMLEVVQYGNHQWGRLDRGWVQITGYITLEYVEEPVEHDHSYGDWYTVREATASENGLERRDCQYCDHYEEREVIYEAPTVSRVYATITVYSLNIRSGPGSNYTLLGYVVKGEVYEVLEQTTVNGKVWGRIEKGWICLTGYTTLEEVVEDASGTAAVKTVTATFLNVRAGAGTGYNIVTSLAYGTKVTVLEQKVVGGVTWARIEQGWVSMEYLA